jgi:putative phosphoribosyl transferase
MPNFFENQAPFFQDRKEAGFKLGQKLKSLGFSQEVLILAIPRGGVVVGKRVADILGAEFDIIAARKLQAPANPELAIGAVGQEGRAVLDKDLIAELSVSHSYLKAEIKRQRKEAKRREDFFRHGKKPQKISGRVVILVDDGIATGSTVLAAAKIIKSQKPKKLVLAVPVAPLQTIKELEKNFDQLVILETPADFGAVGRFYQNFPQFEDWEVKKILNSKF